MTINPGGQGQFTQLGFVANSYVTILIFECYVIVKNSVVHGSEGTIVQSLGQSRVIFLITNVESSSKIDMIEEKLDLLQSKINTQN